MLTQFLLQTFGPVAFGLIFKLSGLLGEKPRWLGQLAFLLSQLVLIYAFGYGSVVGIGFVAVVLFGFALSVSSPSATQGVRRVHRSCSSSLTLSIGCWRSTQSRY